MDVARLYVWPVKRTNELLDETPLTGWLNVATIGPFTVDGVVMATDVGPVIVKHPVQTLCPPLSELSNVTSLVVPGVAVPETSIVVLRVFAFKNSAGECCVILELEKATVVVESKPEPTK